MIRGDMPDAVTVIIDRWPKTEAEFEGLISSLRLEFSVQAERRIEEEAGICLPYPPLQTLYIHDLAQ